MSAASPSLLQEVEASDVESDTGSDIDVIDEKRSRSSDGRGSDGDGYSTNIDSSSGNGSSSNSKTLYFSTQRRLRSFTTTTCTTCSICIEEFENGEKKSVTTVVWSFLPYGLYFTVVRTARMLSVVGSSNVEC